MDESHRLKELPKNYDEKLFNQLYKETSDLRKKLAWNIDSRKFGVDYNEILSWFDIKFIHAFVRYYGDDKLKGFIIKSLQTYQIRIIKNSYHLKHGVNNSVDISELYSIADESDYSESRVDTLFSLVEEYFRNKLSMSAYMVWEIGFNVPPYILKRISHSDNKKIPKCPDYLIMEYLGITARELKDLRDEIKDVNALAKSYFQLKGYKL